MTHVHNISGMKVVTHYSPTPIPDRQFDWVAVDDNTYDGHGCPIGYGRTEQDAITDLLNEIEWRKS